MKNLVLSALAILTVSISFAQKESKQSITAQKKNLKNNEVQYIQKKADLNPVETTVKPIDNSPRVKKVIGPKIRSKKINLPKENKIKPKENFKEN